MISSTRGLGSSSNGGGTLTPAEAAAGQTARLASWNAATKAADPANTLTIADYLAPGDSLSNWPANVTPTDMANWYTQNAQVIWIDPNGNRTTTLPSGNAAANYVRTGDYAFVTPNGKLISSPGGSLVPDAWGGPVAIAGSRAAKVYLAAYLAGGGDPNGAPPNVTSGADYNGPSASGTIPSGVNYALTESTLSKVNNGVQTQVMSTPVAASVLVNTPGATVNDVTAAAGLSPASTLASTLANTVSGWSTQTWLLVAAAAAGALYMFSSKGGK